MSTFAYEGLLPPDFVCPGHTNLYDILRLIIPPVDQHVKATQHGDKVRASAYQLASMASESYKDLLNNDFHKQAQAQGLGFPLRVQPIPFSSTPSSELLPLPPQFLLPPLVPPVLYVCTADTAQNTIFKQESSATNQWPIGIASLLQKQDKSLDVVSKQEPSATNQSPVGLASLLQEQKDNLEG
ncbi:hypothetical protein ZIOFF_030325 [Zingiber officinale]|uniref:Uncharacterized protein n=1 Tax=Zingiber officinale TaxID=94328 RepID=A0A8J5GZQ2_ZINOF|nr:hypothetical protein ZIOFF_030325 [Zingiber officinale]